MITIDGCEIAKLCRFVLNVVSRFLVVVPDQEGRVTFRFSMLSPFHVTVIFRGG